MKGFGETRIRCEGGPADGRMVRSGLGNRWPWVCNQWATKYDQFVLAWYVLDGDHYVFEKIERPEDRMK